jgi:hypothetical protein
MLWYTRECSVAVYVANLPGIWPLLRENIRFLRTHTSSYHQSNSALPRYGTGTVTRMQRTKQQSTSTPDDELELGRNTSFATKSLTRSIHSTVKPKHDDTIRSGSSDSDVRVLNDGWGKGMNLDIRVDREIEVERSSWDDRSRGGKDQFEWELENRGPKTIIEGPEGQIKTN